MPEEVNSAIRSIRNEGQTIVATSAGRWLIVEGYSAEFKAAYATTPHRAPLVQNLTVLGETDEREFMFNCCTDDRARA